MSWLKSLLRWLYPEPTPEVPSPMIRPQLIDKMLPTWCYSSRTLRTPRFIIQHYFSAINVVPRMPYDPEICWRLFHDLNLPPEHRKFGMYRGPRTPASAHIFIARDGAAYLFVPMNMIAWHAGVSRWDGHENLNQHSFGIENAGAHGQPFTDVQYETNARICAWLMQEFPIIGFDNILGHDQIAWPRGRKKDPGPKFNWEKLFDYTRQELSP